MAPSPLRRERRRRRRPTTVFGVLGLLVVVPVILALLAIAALPALDTRLLVVLSGSMEPTIATGDAVLVRETAPEDVAPGDVITYRGYGSDRLTTHRVTDVREVRDRLHFRTQGDANATPDPNLAPAEGLEGRVLLRLPRFGWVALELQRPVVRLVGLALPAAILAVGAVRDLLHVRRSSARPAPRRRPRASSPVGTSLPTYTIVLAIGGLTVAMGAGVSLAAFVDRDVLGDNTFSTLAVRPPVDVTVQLDCGESSAGKGVVVRWSNDADVDSHEVLRATTTGGPYTSLATVGGDVSEYKDTAVDNETTYHYVVRTVVDTWTSAPSPEATITTPHPSECSLQCAPGGGGGQGRGRANGGPSSCA